MQIANYIVGDGKERAMPPLKLDPRAAAVVAIDLKRQYLDPSIGNHLLPPAERARILDRVPKLFSLARERGIPVIHVALDQHNTPWLPPEKRANPFARAMAEEKGAGRFWETRLSYEPRAHEFMAQVSPSEGDIVINYKRSFSSFMDTDLDRTLRVLATRSVILTGINTNTCVHCAAFDASNLGYQVIVVEDCVASSYGDDLHRFALENIRRCIGWVVPLADLEARFSQRVAVG